MVVAISTGNKSVDCFSQWVTVRFNGSLNAVIFIAAPVVLP
jgi:hypothetical protein